MNYMKQVAQMLGLELEEEFYLKGVRDKHKITNDGMFYRSKKDGSWFITSWTLNKVLAGKLEIIKEPKPILDETEKEYLSNVIKPFRDKVTRIGKFCDDDKNLEFISVVYKDYGVSATMWFPYFEKGSMYKGMEIGKNYSVGDLEL